MHHIFARVSHSLVVTEEHRALRAVDRDAFRLLEDARWLVELEAGVVDRLSRVSHRIHLEPFVRVWS